MTIVLQGIALNEQPMSQPLIGRFDERGGTLGRSDAVTFTLPDPERTISRIQAQVLYRDDGYWIENVSAANPILHNGRTLSSGMRVILREGDELRIGGYTLRATLEKDEMASATILRGRTVTAAHLDAGSAAAPTRAPSGRSSLRGAGVASPLAERSSIELLSAMRSAMEAVLDRIDPAKLEASLGKSAFETLRPARYKARLWELYLERFRALRLEAQGDMKHLFDPGSQ